MPVCRESLHVKVGDWSQAIFIKIGSNEVWKIGDSVSAALSLYPSEQIPAKSVYCGLTEESPGGFGRKCEKQHRLIVTYGSEVFLKLGRKQTAIIR